MKEKYSMKNTFSNYKIKYFLILQLLGIFYYFFLGDKGPLIMRDSIDFINPSGFISRNYWLYTTFVSVCRMIAGEKFYLYLIFSLQGILALIASWLVTEFFRDFYKLNHFESTVVYMITFLPYGYSLPENVVTHHILTEGIAIPLFQICLLYCIRLFLEKCSRYLIIILITAILLMLTRPQLLIIVPIIIVLFIVYFIKRSNWQNIRKLFIFMAGIFLGIFTFLLLLIKYTSIEDQLYAAISGRVLCIMEYEDRNLFEGEKQEIFDHLYETLDAEKHLEKYFGKDSWRSYDIGYHTNENTKNVIVIIRDYYKSKYFDCDYSSFFLQSYYDRNEIVKRLFLNNIGSYLSMTGTLIMESMVVGIFIQPDSIRNLCYIVAGLMYLFLIMVYVYASKCRKVEKIFLIPLQVTMLFFLTNILLINLVFYGQQRYVIYTFGMIYISIFILIVGIWHKKKGEYK